MVCQGCPGSASTHSVLRTVPAQGWQLHPAALGTKSRTNLTNTIQHPQILMCQCLLPALPPAPCHLLVALARQGTDPCGFSKKFLVISPKAKAAATGSSWHVLGWAHSPVGTEMSHQLELSALPCEPLAMGTGREGAGAGRAPPAPPHLLHMWDKDTARGGTSHTERKPSGTGSSGDCGQGQQSMETQKFLGFTQAWRWLQTSWEPQEPGWQMGTRGQDRGQALTH